MKRINKIFSYVIQCEIGTDVYATNFISHEELNNEKFKNLLINCSGIPKIIIDTIELVLIEKPCDFINEIFHFPILNITITVSKVPVVTDIPILLSDRYISIN